MAVAHVVVVIPKRGRVAYLENLSLALYGRGRTSMATKDVPDLMEERMRYFLEGPRNKTPWTKEVKAWTCTTTTLCRMPMLAGIAELGATAQSWRAGRRRTMFCVKG